MKTWVAIRGPVHLMRNDVELRDPAALGALNGVRPELNGDVLADFLPPELLSLGLDGGEIELKLEGEKLCVETRYDVKKPLAEDACLKLLSYTVGQWAEGFSGCVKGLGPAGAVLSIWKNGDEYGLLTSEAPERRVTWTLVETEQGPRRVAAFAKT